MLFVEPLQETAGGAIGFCIDRSGAIQVTNGLGGVEISSLKGRGEEAGPPVIDGGLRRAAGIGDRDVGREVLIFAPQGVAGPGAHTGEAVEGETGRHVVFARAVRVGLAFDGMQEADVVGQFPEVGHQIGNHLARFTSRLELPGTLSEVPLLPLEGDEFVAAGHWFTMHFDERRFVVEGIQVTAGSGAENDDDIFRCGRKMGIAGGEGLAGIDFGPDGGFAAHGQPGFLLRREQMLFGEHRGESDTAQTADGLAEEVSAVEQMTIRGKRVLRSAHV